MKTSLIIDDRVFAEAKKEAMKTGKTMSDIISMWAQLGRETWRNQQKQRRRDFKAVDLGDPKLDLSNRKNWMEELEDDRD